MRISRELNNQIYDNVFDKFNIKEDILGLVKANSRLDYQVCNQLCNKIRIPVYSLTAERFRGIITTCISDDIQEYNKSLTTS